MGIVGIKSLLLVFVLVLSVVFVLADDNSTDITDSVVMGNGEASEKVICLFNSSKEDQRCYSKDEKYQCQGVSSCEIDIYGGKNEEISFASSCSGFDNILVDRKMKYIEFFCGKTINTTVNNYQSGYWICEDGMETYRGGPDYCESESNWKRYADDFCRNKCKLGKCGVKLFKPLYECGKEIILGPALKYPILIDPFNIETLNKINDNSSLTVYICKGCVSDDKCYAERDFKGISFCENGLFKEQFNGNEVCSSGYQCRSNVCISGRCLKESPVKMLLNWIKKVWSEWD